MKENKEGLIDSNILIYAYDISEGNKHKIASNFVAEKLLGDKAVFSIQILSEFLFAVTEKLSKPVSEEIAKQIVLDLTKSSKILRHSENTLVEALNIKQAYDIHFWDALIASNLRENNVSLLYTENVKDFKKVEWLEIINPLISSDL